MRIPTEIEHIDKTWLSAALGAPVRSVEVVDAHAGTTGRAVLQIDYDALTALPSRLFVKLPPNDEMQRAFVTSSGMGKREATVYRTLGDELPVRVPRCYYADSDEEGLAYIMLLEHLEDSGCTFNNASEHYSLDYLRKILSAFARLHAAYWESPRFASDLNWLQPPLQHDIAIQLIQVALEKHGNEMPPVFTEMAQLYLAHANDIHALWQRGPQTVIHGDVHDANLFMDAEEPGFLDWALVARGPALRDVGYFLAGTVEEGDRIGLKPLLEFYRRELVSLGVSPPGLDELWQQMQWHAAYVWVGAAVTLAMGDAWQPVNYVMSSLNKLHGAMESLDSVAAIRRAIA